MQRRPFQIARPDFARIVTRKFAPTRLLLVGSEAAQFVEHCRQEGIDTVSCAGICELEALSENGAGPFDVATWFYPAASATAEDVRTLDRLSTLASSLVLVPATGADAAKRRPPLVAHLGTRSFFPNYDCDISDLEPAALQLTHEASESAATQVRAVEGAFSRLNRHVRGLERRLRTRMSELEAADRHIATLEQKLLKAKEAKRELKQLKQEKQALRKSPERKIGQVLLAPYRLPQKLVREVRKRFPKAGPRERFRARERIPTMARGASGQERGYRVTPRRGARVCLPAVYQHHHAGLQHSGGVADRVRRIGPESDLRKMGAHSGR